MGGVGHWTDHCSPLKYKMKNLLAISKGLLKFENKSNLIQNSLPTHGNNNNAGPSTNEISNKKRLKPSQLITPSGIYRLSFDDEEDLPGVAVIYPNLTPPEGKTADSMEEASANDTMFQQVASSIEQMKEQVAEIMLLLKTLIKTPYAASKINPSNHQDKTRGPKRDLLQPTFSDYVKSQKLTKSEIKLGQDQQFQFGQKIDRKNMGEKST